MAGDGAVGAGAGAASARAVHMLGGATMGTLWQAAVVAPAGTDLHALHDGIQDGLDCVVAQMSTWEHDSDISRYNRALAGTWQALPQPFFDVLREALAIAADTGGAVDPTIGPLVAAWGFGPGGPGGLRPDPDALAAARARVGWARVELDEAALRALQPGGVGLDLSGIAKGHGVDAAVQWLRARGVAAALVEVGGELRGYGRKPDGSAWRVLAEAWPEAEAEAPCVIVLDDAAIATSGDHWHHFEDGGRRYSHTIDPRSGAPVDHAAGAVSVVAGTALQADAWATALMVLGPDEGLALAQARGIAARWITRDAGDTRTRTSDAFRQHLAR